MTGCEGSCRLLILACTDVVFILLKQKKSLIGMDQQCHS